MKDGDPKHVEDQDGEWNSINRDWNRQCIYHDSGDSPCMRLVRSSAPYRARFIRLARKRAKHPGCHNKDGRIARSPDPLCK
ncbi:hypothetical protein EVAR_9163_1 [Eumeta japonica]|uniref:Uncharacterized protein n=1 Tax=Eumeta variegata TaxID=151549 RepID=A0A4C1TXF8_EUMVA|nr:hypothetical protein EVAR_9163_1 [Eumeta japonica]